MEPDLHTRELINQLEQANETIRQLREAMRFPVEVRFQGLILTNTETIIVAALLIAPSLCSHNYLNNRISLVRDRTREVEGGTLRVQICRLRKKLKALRPAIMIFTSWDKGYWFDDGGKAQLLALKAEAARQDTIRLMLS